MRHPSLPLVGLTGHGHPRVGEQGMTGPPDREAEPLTRRARAQECGMQLAEIKEKNFLRYHSEANPNPKAPACLSHPARLVGVSQVYNRPRLAPRSP